MNRYAVVYGVIDDFNSTKTTTLEADQFEIGEVSSRPMAIFRRKDANGYQKMVAFFIDVVSVNIVDSLENS